MFVLLLAACGTSVDSSGEPAGDSGAPSDAPVWYGDVEPIVGASCTGCHVEGGIGGFALDSYDAAKPMAAAMASSVQAKKMPPWKADDDCREYRDDLSLSPEALQRIVDWAAAGAPEGDAAKSIHEAAPVETLSRVDATLTLPVPYTPSTTRPDDYRCFLVDWPVDHDTYMTGYVIHPDQTSIVHHLVAYIAPPQQLAEFEGLDAQDEEPGWTCFGGPGIANQQDAEWLGAWAPGGTSGDFPNGTGIPMKTGSKVVLQMHYNTSNAGAVADQTTMDVMFDDDVDVPATIQPWADPDWLDGTGMEIPAGTNGTEHEFSFAFPRGGFQIHNASLHMHQLGRTARLEVGHSDGTSDCLLAISDWDFNWQRTYTFAEPYDVLGGDALTVRCTWDNPGSEEVNWGEGTSDEMCLGTMLFSY